MRPQARKKGIKIDAKLLKKKKLECSNCKHYDTIDTEYAEGLGMCYANITNNEPISARGARSEDKWCGMRGSKFEPKGSEEVKLIEEMTLEELEAIDTKGIRSQDKRRITLAKNKLKKA